MATHFMLFDKNEGYKEINIMPGVSSSYNWALHEGAYINDINKRDSSFTHYRITSVSTCYYGNVSGGHTFIFLEEVDMNDMKICDSYEHSKLDFIENYRPKRSRI